MVPWKEGKPLTWDAIVICPLADGYIDASARDAGSAAELTSLREVVFIGNICKSHCLS